MHKRMAVTLGLGFASVAFGITSASKADFIDNFNNGVVADSDTIPGFWSTGTYAGGTQATATEQSGPPSGTTHLTLAYSGAAGTQNGPYIYSAVSPGLSFFNGPSTYTLTAAPGGNLIPGTDYSANNLAQTYLGMDGNSGGFRLDSGTNRVFVELSNQNVPTFVIKDSLNATTYSFGYFGLPSGANIDVTQMFLYLDGSTEGSDHFYMNFGETYTDTNTNITTSVSFDQKLGLSSPFDLGVISPSNSGGGNKTQAQLDAVKAGFSNGASLELEVLNFAANGVSNESVAIGQVSAVVPEPASISLVAAGLGLLCRRTRRRT